MHRSWNGSNVEGEMPLLAACLRCANAESLRIKYDEKESIKQQPAAEDCQRYADCRQTCYDAIVLMPVTCQVQSGYEASCLRGVVGYQTVHVLCDCCCYVATKQH